VIGVNYLDSVNNVLLSYADLESVEDCGKLFPQSAPLELEVGCGRGDFLLAYAALHPEINFVGIERKLVIARKAASKIQRAGLGNVRIVHGEVQYLLERYVRKHSVGAIHCYFPDPWPKKRHAKRRLFREGTPQWFAEMLIPGGWFHVRTDVEEYYQVILDLFSHEPRFVREDPPAELIACLTGFEKRFVAEGKSIYRASFRLSSNSGIAIE